MNANPMSSSYKLENAGKSIIRYGLALVLIWIGLLKFTSYEAMGIQPLVEHSPLLSWALSITGISGVSKFIGIAEILFGALIAAKRFSAKASVIGSLGACVTFFITLTFLFSTPPVWQPDYGFPYLSPMPGQFLLKDIVLFGASLYTAGEALAAVKKRNYNTAKQVYYSH